MCDPRTGCRAGRAGRASGDTGVLDCHPSDGEMTAPFVSYRNGWTSVTLDPTCVLGAGVEEVRGFYWLCECVRLDGCVKERLLLFCNLSCFA